MKKLHEIYIFEVPVDKNRGFNLKFIFGKDDSFLSARHYVKEELSRLGIHARIYPGCTQTSSYRVLFDSEEDLNLYKLTGSIELWNEPIKKSKDFYRFIIQSS